MLILGCFGMLLALLIASEYCEALKKQHVLFKALTSASYICMALVMILTRETEVMYAVLILVSLCFCLVGDVLLSAVKGDSTKIGFTIGVGFFMHAHIVFFFAFSAIQSIAILDFVFLTIIALIVFSLSKLKSLNLKGMIPILLVYSICLGFLTSKAITLVIVQGFTLLSTIIFVGCGLFLVSDVILIFELFGVKKIKILTFFNLITYYAGTILLAISVGFSA